MKLSKREWIPGRSESHVKRRFYRFVVAFACVTLIGLGHLPEAYGQDSPKASSALIAKSQATDRVRVIVKLNTSFQPEGRLSGPQAATSQRSQIANRQNQLQQAVAHHNVRGVKKFKFIPFTAMEVDSAALTALLADPLVASIEEDVPVPPALTDSAPLIKADQAWTAGYTGAGWTVAILDTGVDKTHSFIGPAKVVAEACFSTTDAGYPSTTVCPGGAEAEIGAGTGVNCGGPLGTAIDGCQHGTHVAGIAAGKTAGINGVAKDANIIAVQVFSSFTGTTCTDIGYASPCALSFTSDQILALEHVYSLRTTYNIAAANMSLGGGKYTPASIPSCDSDYSSTKAAIDTLRSVGIATVIASGNSSYTDGISAPACISTAVSVGAATKSDVEAVYSSYHPTMLSLFAPGSAITSSIPGGGWDDWNGTSMATPHVAGAWAILKQKSPTASVTAVLNSFQTTGVAITTKPGDLAGGTVKRIDVLTALTFPPSGLSVAVSSISSISLNWTDNSSDELGFKIERKTGTGGIYGQIGTTGAGITTYADSGLSEGTTYTYRVRAYNAGADSAYSNEASTTIWPAAPSGLSATPVAINQINLSWADNSVGETGFKIERKTGAGGIYSQIAVTTDNTTTYSDATVTASTTYVYRIKAYNAGGDSAYSTEGAATTPAPPAPSAGGGGGGGGCFIATAAFGTPMEKHVRILRDFRDGPLLTTSAGQAFVNFYYRVSPPIADRIAQSEVLRCLTRGSLMPLVGMAYLLVTYGTAATLLCLLLLILFTVAAVLMISGKIVGCASQDSPGNQTGYHFLKHPVGRPATVNVEVLQRGSSKALAGSRSAVAHVHRRHRT